MYGATCLPHQCGSYENNANLEKYYTEPNTHAYIRNAHIKRLIHAFFVPCKLHWTLKAFLWRKKNKNCITNLWKSFGSNGLMVDDHVTKNFSHCQHWISVIFFFFLYALFFLLRLFLRSSGKILLNICLA